MEEEYKLIDDYPKYSVSNLGNIRNDKTTRILKKNINDNGYYIVDLCKNNKRKTFKVHRIIAEAFVLNPENKPYVDHIDNNKLNNSINNLRWCTPSENQQNRQRQKNNSSGIKGVHFDKHANKWRMELLVNGKIYKKYSNTIEEASEARRKKANELYGDFTNECEKIRNELKELEAEFEKFIN